MQVECKEDFELQILENLHRERTRKYLQKKTRKSHKEKIRVEMR